MKRLVFQIILPWQPKQKNYVCTLCLSCTFIKKILFYSTKHGKKGKGVQSLMDVASEDSDQTGRMPRLI